MSLKNVADELKTRIRRTVEPDPGPSDFQMFGGWASPAESADDPYVAEGAARRAGRDALVQLYREQGRV